MWKVFLCYTEQVSLSLQNTILSVPAFLCREGFKLLSCERAGGGCVRIVALHFQFFYSKQLYFCETLSWLHKSQRPGEYFLASRSRNTRSYHGVTNVQMYLQTVKVLCLDRQMHRFTLLFAHGVAGHVLYSCQPSLSVQAGLRVEKSISLFFNMQIRLCLLGHFLTG